MTAPERVSEEEGEKAIETARGTEHFVGSTIPMENLLRRLLDERDALEARVARAWRVTEENKLLIAETACRADEVRALEAKLATARREAYREALERLNAAKKISGNRWAEWGDRALSVSEALDDLADWLQAQAEGGGA